MSGGSRIRAIGPEQPETAGVAADDAVDVVPAAGTGEETEDWPNVSSPLPRRFTWLLPALAFITISGWTAFYGWTYRQPLLTGGTPPQWIEHIVQWSVPTLLVLAVWLLLARNSSREAERFGTVALSLREESLALEERLVVVNRELSLAREFLAAQSRDLESLGRVASERLSVHADQLQSLVRSNGSEVEAIASVSTTALENMGRLRDDLPVIANSARDVANNIGGAGRTAHGQIAELVSGFERLNQFGQASERQVGSLQSRIDAAISAFELQLAQMGDLAAARFDALRTESETFRAELDGREVEAMASLRRRAEGLANELASTRSKLDEDEEEALRSMRARLNALQEEAGQIASAVRDAEQQASVAWAGQVDVLHQRLLTAIEEIKGIDEAALASANRKLEALRHEAENVDRNIAERDARLFAKIAERQQALAKTERDSLAALEERLGALDTLLSERRAEFMTQTDALGSQGQAVAEKLWELRADMRAIAEAGEETEDRLAASIASLAEKLTESRHVLNGTNTAVAELTEGSVRLLELIQASADHTRTQLPAALAEAEGRLGALSVQASDLRGVLEDAARKGEDLSAYVIATQDRTGETEARILALQGQIEAGSAATLATLSGVRDALGEANDQSDALAAKATGTLREAIALLERQAQAALNTIDANTAGAVKAIAERIASQSGVAIEQALADNAQGAFAILEEASAKAAAAGREATQQMRDQLVRVNELASNLETRVARARELAEQQVNNDFSRRVALISEGLNSTAIDIAKVLSTDVSDSTWTAYLRGDRGIFTRRAVRLLDNTEAREIAELYDADSDFRDNVSRYIADFENMLRTLLSTRDGKAVSVTLLSSDMGKLYVALAQAIERLRA
ncbi:MAG: ATPase [Sphingomonadaceae bacterium]